MGASKFVEAFGVGEELRRELRKAVKTWAIIGASAAAAVFLIVTSSKALEVYRGYRIADCVFSALRYDNTEKSFNRAGIEKTLKECIRRYR